MERQVGNRYRLIEPLGEGGMGVVWRAYDELLDRTVAIKEVRYAGVGDAKRAELNSRTIREARAAGRLDHPSVVVIHDVVEEDGRPWIVMQLVRSRSLAQVISEQGPLQAGQVAVIGGRVLDALRAAHATGVLHRDVKPENVLLADDGRVVLTDFGIATLETEAALTATGGVVGTPAYMPPERLNGEPARPESDLWSLGATLYAAVEGEPPFRRGSWAATVAAVLRDEPRPPTRAGALAPVIMGLLHRDPAARTPAEQAARLLYEVANAPAFAGQRTSPEPGRVAAATGYGADGGLLETAGDRPLPTIDEPRPTRPAAGGPRRAVRRRPRRGKAPLIGVSATLAAVAVLGTGGFLLYNSRTSAAPVTSPVPATSLTPAKSQTPTATSRPLPAGWRAFTNAAGRFSIGVPKQWTARKSTTRDSISLTGPGTPGEMRVEWTVPEMAWVDPAKQWIQLEKDIQAKGEFRQYTRIGITSTRYLGRAAADWEFTRVRDGKLIHVINRGFRTADGRPYALYWESLDSRWDQDRHYFEQFAKTFKPL
ncbi:serine/threonine-protein kinase [Nonomuraea sp. H19]|uniref:serine/threonine-protein kinase n=1 Tax=Nonomuraea sp. H19 TaxID=3452206 RepID=UPI003F8A44A7